MDPVAVAQQLYSVFERCWAADTSASPATWTKENPAHGQCAVTALIVQDCMHGALLRGEVEGQSHYWNLVVPMPTWLEVDLTRTQFRNLRGPVPKPTMGDRNYVLSSPDTVRRYDLLKSRVSQHVHVR